MWYCKPKSNYARGTLLTDLTFIRVIQVEEEEEEENRALLCKLCFDSPPGYLQVTRKKLIPPQQYLWTNGPSAGVDRHTCLCHPRWLPTFETSHIILQVWAPLDSFSSATVQASGSAAPADRNP